ncbi:MAG: pyridoxal phosphate-dependent aminotransferase [Candidatus Competibacterales bacterium]
MAVGLSPLVERIAGKGARAWDIHAQALAAKAKGDDVILLSIGDPDLATPAPIVQRAVAALQQGDTHYTAIQGEPALRAAIAERFGARTGLEVGADRVCVLAGAQNGLFCASLLCLRPGDQVLVLDPCYVTYEATIRVSGAEPVVVPSPPETGFRPDLDALARAITPNTRAIWLNNPANPTGVNWTRAELEVVAQVAEGHDLWVISDEVYGGLVFEAEHISIAALPGMAERTVTVSSLSKSHAMTGWRLGWIIAPEALIHHTGNLALAMLYGLPGFVQQAACQALADDAAIIAEMRRIYRTRRDHVLALLAKAPGTTALVPEAGMFLMLDVRGVSPTSEAFAWGLLQQQGVCVLDGAAFGDSSAGHVRLSYTLDLPELTRACRRIEAFCRDGSLGLSADVS